MNLDIREIVRAIPQILIVSYGVWVTAFLLLVAEVVFTNSSVPVREYLTWHDLPWLEYIFLHVIGFVYMTIPYRMQIKATWREKLQLVLVHLCLGSLGGGIYTNLIGSV